jgi:hypothetical protein
MNSNQKVPEVLMSSDGHPESHFPEMQRPVTLSPPDEFSETEDEPTQEEVDHTPEETRRLQHMRQLFTKAYLMEDYWSKDMTMEMTQEEEMEESWRWIYRAPAPAQSERSPGPAKINTRGSVDPGRCRKRELPVPDLPGLGSKPLRSMSDHTPSLAPDDPWQHHLMTLKAARDYVHRKPGLDMDHQWTTGPNGGKPIWAQRGIIYIPNPYPTESSICGGKGSSQETHWEKTRLSESHLDTKNEAEERRTIEATLEAIREEELIRKKHSALSDEQKFVNKILEAVEERMDNTSTSDELETSVSRLVCGPFGGNKDDDKVFSATDQILGHMIDLIEQMMYVSGETGEPSTETTGMIEEIVRQQVVEIVSTLFHLFIEHFQAKLTLVTATELHRAGSTSWFPINHY